ncbi:MAG: signal peptidase I [Polyangiaceae bacterium]
MGAAAVVVLVARTSLADHYTVPSGSMRPTVQIGDRVLVDKAAYGLHLPLVDGYLVRGAEPARGDVVVLEAPDTGIVLLKRIVAVPGDRVEVHSGQVWIDGKPAPVRVEDGAELELLEGGRRHPVALGDGGPDYGPTAVPPDRFRVLGDNGGASGDGRFFGLVRRDALLGRVERVYFRAGGPAWIDLCSPRAAGVSRAAPPVGGRMAASIPTSALVAQMCCAAAPLAAPRRAAPERREDDALAYAGDAETYALAALVPGATVARQARALLTLLVGRATA